MHLHLLSSPGEEPIRDVVDAIRAYLETSSRPLVAYLPAASEGPPGEYLSLTRSAFSGLAEVELVDLASGGLDVASKVLSDSSVIYIPGGNTYLLAEQLRSTGLFEELRLLVSEGLPLVGFSAGMVILGRSLAMSNDQNYVGLEDHSGLGLVPFTFAVHYSDENPEREAFRKRLSAFQGKSTPPVLALQDGAYLRVDGVLLSLVRGRCFLFKGGQEGKLLEIGAELAAA